MDNLERRVNLIHELHGREMVDMDAEIARL